MPMTDQGLGAIKYTLDPAASETVIHCALNATDAPLVPGDGINTIEYCVNVTANESRLYSLSARVVQGKGV